MLIVLFDAYEFVIQNMYKNEIRPKGIRIRGSDGTTPTVSSAKCQVFTSDGAPVGSETNATVTYGNGYADIRVAINAGETAGNFYVQISVVIGTYRYISRLVYSVV